MTSPPAEPLDPDLARILHAWPALPDAIRRAMLDRVGQVTAQIADERPGTENTQPPWPSEERGFRAQPNCTCCEAGEVVMSRLRIGPVFQRQVVMRGAAPRCTQIQRFRSPE